MFHLFIFLGVSGSPIELRANYMRLLSRPMWLLYQYHVDFKPPMESRRLRSALLFNHEDVLGKTKTFDGTILFLPHRLQNTVKDYKQRNPSHCLCKLDAVWAGEEANHSIVSLGDGAVD